MWAVIAVMLQELAVKLAEKHLRGASQQEMQWKDAVSHFVLRLAYCRTEDLRRWFLQHECELFKSRFRTELPASQVHTVPTMHTPNGDAAETALILFCRHCCMNKQEAAQDSE